MNPSMAGLLLSLALLCFTPRSSAALSPRKMVQTSYTNIQRATRTAESRQALLKEVTLTLDKLIDWPSFSIKTLSRSAWEGLDDSGRQRFVAAYRRLIVRRYAKRFKPGATFDVEFRGAEGVPKNDKVWVRTTVHTKDGAKRLGVDVDYDFWRVGSLWRTADIITDGVSRARSYRPKFKRILVRHGLERLIKAIDKNAKKP